MSNSALQDSINELMALHGVGRFADMEQRARTLLKSFPGTPVLYELHGLALAAQHRYADALAPLQRAVRGHPGEAQFWQNLALCQIQLKIFADAEQSLREAVKLQPGAVDTMAALAEVLQALGRPGEAEDSLRAALAIDPRHPAIHFQLGRTLAAQRRFAEAEQHLRVALAAAPQFAAVHNELGLVLRQKGEWQEAEASLRRATELDRANPATHANLALVLSCMNRHQEAAEAARTALALLGDIEAGIADDGLAVLDIIGNVLDAADCFGEAIAVYRAGLRFKDEPLRALWAAYAARRACNFELAASLEPPACRVAEAGARVDDSVPWRLLCFAGATAPIQLAAARKCAQQVPEPATVAHRAPEARARRDRLRIGYMSGDFREHPVVHHVTGVIEAHDRARFEIVAYDISPPTDDAYRQRLLAAFDRCVDLRGLTDRDAIERLAEDDADVLVDLMGWTRGGRPAVLAARPARVQAQWFGHAGTGGMPWIDYVIADNMLVAPGDEANFSERIVRLPDSFQPNGAEEPGEPGSRSACGLPGDGFVFCSFNQAFKITPEIFGVWLELLEAAPGSVLWLAEPAKDVGAALRDRAVSRGLAADRVVFAPRLPERGEHLARLAHADLALDCFPYGSHTTASDMVRAGVPLVALMGETFASRVSASVLAAAGLPELIARSLEDYRRLALRLAGNRNELAALKSRVSAQRRTSPLFDTQRFTRNLETAFVAMADRFRNGLAADHITIE